MEFNQMLQKYAELIVKAGVNVQKEQEIAVNVSVDNANFARLVVEECYKAGAKEVTINWSDEKTDRLRYEYGKMEIFEEIADWKALLTNGLAKRGAGFINIMSSDPDAFAGIDPKKPAAQTKASNRQYKDFYECMDKGITTWCIVATPSPKWATKIFPNLDEDTAITKLWESICKAVRIDTADPIKAWDEHRKSFDAKSKFLNDKQFTKLHMTSANGTDLTVGMLENHSWAGGGAKTPNGVYYFPNMPTEEIFCSPDKNICDGIVYSALPLCYHGTMIENFSLTFKDGQVVDFKAEKGYETLKELIETDDGSKRLGEVALVPKKSPIADMGILFYNTLFDENAACHLAIGRGFPECVENGTDLSKNELSKKGMNTSAVHVDFMFGTADMKIVGTQKDGTEVVVFEDGNWAKIN